MTKKEFEKKYCSECEMCAECTMGCPVYHECEEDADTIFKAAGNELAMKLIQVREVIKRMPFKVLSVRLGSEGWRIHIESVDDVKTLADGLGVELVQDGQEFYFVYCNMKFDALAW